MIIRSSRAHPHGTRSRGRWRLLAATAAPLALAAVAAAPAAAQPAHTTRPAAHAATLQALSQATPAGQSMTLPAVSTPQVTVTLITGDQVTLDQVTPGRYAVSSAGTAPGMDEIALGATGHVTSLQAFPGSTASLVAAGLVNRGLFDLTYLAAHGDTGPAATIPVTIAYPGHPAAATLTAKANAIPGGHLLGVSAASGQARLSVPAARAAQFWAALTGAPRPGSPPSPGGAPRLAGGAEQVWLTGHQVGPTTARPQSGQPTEQLTVTVIGKRGPLAPCGQFTWPLPGGGIAETEASWCPDPVFPMLAFGVAGSGEGQLFSTPSVVCATLTPHQPYPVCTSWRYTFQVPAGIYYVASRGFFATTADPDGTHEGASAVMAIPQVTVTGPTALTLDANKTVPVHLSTPQPATTYWSGIQTTRSSPGGTTFVVGYGPGFPYGFDSNWWMLPTPSGGQATVGSFHLSLSGTLGQPPVTAAVTSPQHLTVRLLYPQPPPFTVGNGGNGQDPPIRFTGQQALQLVDAGEGTASDFAKIDARGKLALIHMVNLENGCAPNPFPGHFCGYGVLPAQLANAKQADAAGVLIDVSHAPYDPAVPEVVPGYFDNQFDQSLSFSQYDIPFAEVSESEAASLRSLLGHGPVAITIDDHGDSPYLYNVDENLEGSVPGSLNYTVSPQTFTRVNAAYHSCCGNINEEQWTAWRPDDLVTMSEPEATFNGHTVTEYFGPVSPSLAWNVQGYGLYQPDPVTQATFSYSDSAQIFGQPGTVTENWNEAPAAPGASGTPSPAVAQDYPDNPYLMRVCAGCRQGDTFWPYFYSVNGATPLTDGGQMSRPTTMHLYDAQGQEIPPVMSSLGLPVFQLPPQQQRYRLDNQYQNPDQVNTFPSTVTTTSWDFTSAEPATDNTPPETACFGTGFLRQTTPCTAPPLVFLRYNASTSLDNTLAAPGTHQLQVTGYHQDPSAPAVTSLKLWTSADGGKTWQQAPLTGGQGGTWTAAYTLPQLSQTDGYLSIKATAADAAGNDVTQTIIDAVKLAVPSSGPAHPGGR